LSPSGKVVVVSLRAAAKAAGSLPSAQAGAAPTLQNPIAAISNAHSTARELIIQSSLKRQESWSLAAIF
jgi:hypothetical protein